MKNAEFVVPSVSMDGPPQRNLSVSGERLVRIVPVVAKLNGDLPFFRVCPATNDDFRNRVQFFESAHIESAAFTVYVKPGNPALSVVWTVAGSNLSDPESTPYFGIISGTTSSHSSGIVSLSPQHPFGREVKSLSFVVRWSYQASPLYRLQCCVLQHGFISDLI